jgi:hypothetical protein
MYNHALQTKERLEVAKLFNTPNHHHKLKWGSLFKKPAPAIENEFHKMADAKNFVQRKIAENTYGWYNRDTGDLDCMLCFINNISDLTKVGEAFELIKEFDPFITYAIVHQKKDGERCFDIFRFSCFSYLEHFNRVYAPKQ